MSRRSSEQQLAIRTCGDVGFGRVVFERFENIDLTRFTLLPRIFHFHGLEFSVFVGEVFGITSSNHRSGLVPLFSALLPHLPSNGQGKPSSRT